MAENTKIQWATHTFNCWRGCTKVSAGCANCYAEKQSKRNVMTLGMWGPNGTRVVASEDMWKEPGKWNRQAECDCPDGPDKPHIPDCPQANVPRVFCASMADVFEDWQKDLHDSRGRRLLVDRICGHKPDAPWLPETPEGSFAAMRPLSMWDVRLRLFRTIFDTPNLDWLLLTKRPENLSRMIADGMNRAWGIPQRQSPFAQWLEDWLTHYKVPENIWLGTSVEDRKAITRIDHLREVPAVVRFLSVEPLLEDLGTIDLTGIHWVIIGGESGPGARPCNIEWIRSIVKQCKAAGVKVFVKQLGAEPICDSLMHESTTLAVLRDPKGGDMAEWPEDLRIREIPGVS